LGNGEQFFLEQFRQRQALWIYQGEPRAEAPHGLMTSGKHSKGYFNSTPIVRDPKLLSVACGTLLHSISVDPKDVGEVWGSAMGAIMMAYELAQQIGALSGYTEKQEGNMVVGRNAIQPGTRVLLVEDVITTGGTTLKTVAALESAGAIVMGEILALVNRSGLTELNGRKIVSLIEQELPLWSAAECPYCRVGSEALRPKGENWFRLVGTGGETG
jgi:orotate phosphoribosyltransferase